MSARFAEWGHWGIGLWNGDRNVQATCRKVAELSFPVGPQGPADGFIGSPERQRWQEACKRWVELGELPEGAYCSATAASTYDPEHPNARWIGGRWVSAVRVGKAWVFPEVAA